MRMRLYLMQHGLSMSKEEDPDRPLTDEGRAEVERVASLVGRAGITLDAVRHSGKTRARQTAEILGARLGPAEVIGTDGLAPVDDPRIAADRLVDPDGATALVGHLPHLSRLATLLLTGAADREVVAFRNGGLVCLDGGEDGWRLRWIVTPEVIAG